ncbi:DUF423 domain-containing protein [Pedobacter flavus]|uniref:DUF423 domain-containing protein n=1 Tax=Pedobacter flavus TaxID=3113906 RepID=A0ABU7H4F6_9SPHI|nr:DUF423 domain-containing protein [Pedobacter sp. VNH31]MEE1885466.1 DUF423 domain-containing protein [Pedobacter sp. VNH31]
MNKKIILTAAVFGIIAVIFGAFGAHTLKDQLSSSELSTWDKGVTYQFYHTLALLYLSTFARYKNNLINIGYFCFVAGIICFSGSLYVLATRSITGIEMGQLGLITPIGGLFFILGWLMLFLAALKDK